MKGWVSRSLSQTKEPGMIKRLKKTAAVLSVCLLMGGAGMASGQAAQQQSADTMVIDHNDCEEDECEDGWFGYESCEANTGNRTSCDSHSDGCTTGGC
jgi:hypothetical protein